MPASAAPSINSGVKAGWTVAFHKLVPDLCRHRLRPFKDTISSSSSGDKRARWRGQSLKTQSFKNPTKLAVNVDFGGTETTTIPLAVTSKKY